MTSQWIRSQNSQDETWQTIAAFTLDSRPGNEQEAMRLVAGAVGGIEELSARMEQVKTAVAEAVMNAMEHGNRYNPDLPVDITVRRSLTAISIKITDRGGERPEGNPPAPDIDAKLKGRQPPRGWGLFLIKKMVDEAYSSTKGELHTVTLILKWSPAGEDHPIR